ncbi:MAG: Helix-turn-helix, type 11 domain protein [Candidatus Brocadiaceae bacterium]|nr:Helix-turn-helix, type 11 domain protein [Candidatus Brocadiaceae bacterium]
MYAYNPRKKSFQQLEKSLVGKDRWDILNSILKELSLKKGESPKQHWMVVGPRGIGKSHLLSLLYYKITNDDTLRNLWIPVLFPEEIRMAGDLAKFLERAVREICQDLEKTNDSLVIELQSKIDGIKKVPSDERREYLFSVLTWIHTTTGRYILLITENLQQLLGKRISVIEQKKLRAYLQTEEAVLLIGSATTVFDALHDHSHPFYHFFHISRLEDLSFDDLKSLVINLLTDGNQHELAKKVAANEARIRALYSFTGGNPRIAVFLAAMLKAEMPDEMMAVMDKILDEMTPYFEAILSEVPRYQEEILNTLAAYEPAQSPKDIAAHLEIPQPTVRNYLMQLKENGYVKIAFSKGKYSYYCLKEYLYRIWYQMRDSGHREETRWLMELLLMLYSPAAIVEEKKRLEQGVSVKETSEFYSTMISKAASFIAENPDDYKVIEMCVTAAVGDSDKASLQGKKLLKAFKKCLSNGEYEEAIKICTERLKIDTSDDTAYFLWGICACVLKRYDEAIEKFAMISLIKTKSKWPLLLVADCLKRLQRYEDALIAHLRCLHLYSTESLINLDLQEIFKKYTAPLIGTLKPEDYLKQFYTQDKDSKFSRPVLATLLLMLGKYDVINEHVADIITVHYSEGEKERQEVELFIFTIKLCIWLKLSEGKVYEALRVLELFIQRVKLLQSTGEKEKEVSDLILSLFKLQIHMKVEAGSTREMLNAIRVGGVPFNEVFIKVWTCISEPDSVDAQKYLNERAIGEIVTSLKETAKPTSTGCGELQTEA